MNNELIIIESKIYKVRGVEIMLDADLATLYEIETKVLKQAVRRNIERFPEDFMFRLTNEECKSLIDSIRSQNVTLDTDWFRYPPFAFTENGVAMLSSVLRSPLAIQVNINIMRTFTKMRQFVLEQRDSNLSVHDELAQIKQQLSEIAEDLESNERDHETLFNAIAEISLKLQLNQSNPGRITIKGFQKEKEQ